MELQVFNNKEFGKIRTIERNGVVWFVGNDVASILGYSQTSKAIREHVRDNHKGVSEMDTPGGMQKMVIIDEAGLYSLVMRSKLPQAEKFQEWVTSEVLPAIRKHGLYAIDDILENPDIAIAALTKLKEERAKRKELECQNLVQRQQIAELQPKASYYDLILQTKSVVPITQIAKDYGMSGRKLNELLHELGVQYRMCDTWLLYQKYAEYGYTQSKTYAIDENKSAMHTYWTQKGRLFLYDLLKKNDVYPLIEQVEQEANDEREKISA